MKHDRSSLLAALFLPLAVGGLSGYFIRDSVGSYQQLLQPPLAPPPMAFPIVWTLLYLLMGYASWQVYHSGFPSRWEALAEYALSLALNFCWPLIFFLWGSYLLALLWLIVLLLVVADLTGRFWRIRPSAGLLLLPTLLWTGFAAYLNLGIYLLNR